MRGQDWPQIPKGNRVGFRMEWKRFVFLSIERENRKKM
jgi:hypothetical protein